MGSQSLTSSSHGDCDVIPSINQSSLVRMLACLQVHVVDGRVHGPVDELPAATTREQVASLRETRFSGC